MWVITRHDPEKDFIAQALNNTYWLRDKIRSLVDVEIWIVPVIVFTNAFVERTAPVKGVRTINQKFLLDLLQTSTSNAQNLAVWEKREKIRSARNACG